MGWSDAREKITITASWLDKSVKIQEDSSGHWSTKVKTTNSKDAQTIEIKSYHSDFTLTNVLFGEVWLCSGQSNMQMPIIGFGDQPVYGSVNAIAKSGNPNLRLFTVGRVGTRSPIDDIEKFTAWEQSSPENVKDFSAIAYFFGKQLQEILNVPVGIIHSSWAGSSVEPWISKEVLSGYQEINIEKANLQSANHVQTALFNAMINPLIPYTIRGVLWYQGESNRNQSEEYKKLFPAMVKDWRTRWGIGDFPFYYVQIAPYLYGGNDAFHEVSNSSFILEAQLQCLDLIPNSGMVVTMDVGDEYSIHPPKKKEVAERLLYNALNKTYGINAIDCLGPEYISHEVKEDGILLKFDNAENGLCAYEGVKGFEIAGEDKIFYPAEAHIKFRAEVVLVKSNKVSKPVAVRYAWRNYITGTIFDTSMLPASSFRTDDWDFATRAEK